MALNTDALINATYMQTLFEDAWFVARDENIMARLALNFVESDEAKTRTASAHDEATMVAIGETDDLQSQTFTPSTGEVLTPAEVGAQYFITDKRVSSDPFGVRNDAAMELGQATAKKINTDLVGDFASLTGGTIGAAGTTITWGHFFAAEAVLKNANAPPPFRCVLHVYQWHRLASAASIANTTVGNSPWLQDEITKRWFVGNVANVDIFITSDITVDTSDDAIGGMYSPTAIALDMRRAPRLEPERDASRRGFELNMTTVYAHGVWRPAFGVAMKFDAATPTS